MTKSNQQLMLEDGSTLNMEVALKFKMENYQDSVLGNRFLCRGSGGLLIGQSAIGKSSFILQMAAHLAVGKEFFGLRGTNGKLKVLLVQSENDACEMAEVLQSVTEDWREDDLALLKQQLVLQQVWNKMGGEFGRWLRDAVAAHNPDLVIVDPLMGFLGADVLSNEAVTTFMREHVNSVLKNPPEGCRQFGLIFVHHTGKPAGSGKKEDRITNAIRMYNMLGASELVNWARCIMRLDPAMEKGRCHFLLPKRGDRSGVAYYTAQEEWGCAVRHASAPADSTKRGYRWELADQKPVTKADMPVTKATAKKTKTKSIIKASDENLEP